MKMTVSVIGLFGALMVNPFPNKPWFLCIYIISLLKTLWEKEKLLVKSNFSFSHSVFYQCGELPANFIKFEIVICTLLVWKSLKFVVWERVKTKTGKYFKYSLISEYGVLLLSQYYFSQIMRRLIS